MRLHEITDKMREQTVKAVALVAHAYEFAETAHESHRRYSGEPYFIHLFETARLIAELGADAEAIAAGFLHDSIEDVGVRPETIKKEFGPDVLMIVEGVTKLGHLRYRGVDRYSESMRRLFIASSKDLRVLIVKLCDRLHNMRTLAHVPSEKHLRIAKETLEIYAPIAHRLGIRKVSRELEELSFPFAYPEEYARVTSLLREKQTELVRKLEKFHRSVLKDMAKQGVPVTFSEERLKGAYSLYTKLRIREWDFEKIYDTLAIRLIVPTVEECYRALGVIHGSWRPLPGRIKDYIAFPKPNGYRSLHTTVFGGDGSVVEVQIRTDDMHREAEYGVAFHPEYKEREKAQKRGRKKRLIGKLFGGNGIPAWVRELGDLDSAMEDQEYWEHLREDFFKNRIFTLTPKGDVVDLPTESTPVDFAYAIHSDIGDHLVGAKVNGKLVSIGTELHNGDIVEIQTKHSSHPTEKWLDIAKTTVAKKHIRNALQKLKI